MSASPFAHLASRHTGPSEATHGRPRAHTRNPGSARRAIAHVVLLTGLVAGSAAQATAPELFLPPFPELQLTGAADAPRAGATAQPAILGRWITASGNLEVDIAPCGAALCGTVTRVLGNRSMARHGEMQPVDARPAVGMQILRDLVPAEGDETQAGDARWVGDIYNRENGRTYRCRVHLDTSDGNATTLVVRPYVFTPLFGQTQRWQRVGESWAGQVRSPEAP